jgi:LAO/AO transport system kinase
VKWTVGALAEALAAGDRRALARGLSIAEDEMPGKPALMRQVFPATGHAWILGVTGAPGTGKSSLVSALTGVYRSRGHTVGILAVDPTSPFSGGAILGDRIRMREHSGDAGVFIRSMATRGSLGGLAWTTRDCVRILDAAGFDLVIVETVGAGQSEVDIARTAHTTIVVEAPGLGDDVQAIKAGILEIADILVVNKSDRPGAMQTVRALKAMLELGHPSPREGLVRHHGQAMRVEAPAPATTEAPLWIPPVIQTVAPEGSGIDDLVAAIDAHRDHVNGQGARAAQEGRLLREELIDRLSQSILRYVMTRVPATEIDARLEMVRNRRMDPQAAVRHILADSGIITEGFDEFSRDGG